MNQERAIIEAIKLLLDTLSPEGRMEVGRLFNVGSLPRGTPLLRTVFDEILKRQNATSGEILSAIKNEKPKDVYNAIGYLKRVGLIKGVGYGRYEIVNN